MDTAAALGLGSAAAALGLSGSPLVLVLVSTEGVPGLQLKAAARMRCSSRSITASTRAARQLSSWAGGCLLRLKLPEAEVLGRPRWDPAPGPGEDWPAERPV